MKYDVERFLIKMKYDVQRFKNDPNMKCENETNMKCDLQRFCVQAQKANGPPPAFVRAGPSGVK